MHIYIWFIDWLIDVINEFSTHTHTQSSNICITQINKKETKTNKKPNKQTNYKTKGNGSQSIKWFIYELSIITYNNIIKVHQFNGEHGADILMVAWTCINE